MKRLKALIRKMGPKEAFSSKDYWERRYSSGGNSGLGSYGKMAEFKASVVNKIVEENEIRSVIDFGCGDGNQLTLAKYPKYIGMDVSKKSIEICSDLFKNDKTKSFFWYDAGHFVNNRALTAELGLSMEVIFHLIEYDVYHKYLVDLISASTRYILVMSTCRDQPEHIDAEGNVVPHLTHRNFINDMQKINPAITLVKTIDNIVEEKKDIKFYLLKVK